MTDGIQTVSISPAYVYTQSTTPSDKTQGKIWVDTSTSPPTTKVSDGTTYNTLSTDVSAITQTLNENAMQILVLDANASLTAQTYEKVYNELYSSSGGYRSSVNTGSSTANFSTNLYNNSLKTNEVGTTAYSTTISATAKIGIQIKTNANACSIFSVSKDSHCTATTAYIYNSAQSTGGAVGTLITSQAFSGNTATLASPPSLTANTWYWILVDSTGGSYTVSVNENPASFPYVSTNLNFTYGMDSAGSPANTWLNLQPSAGVIVTQRIQNALVQSNAQTLASSPSLFEISTFTPVTTGTGTITYDVSFNGGTNYQTGILPNTQTTITNTGTSLIVKQNLNAGASLGSASARGFSVYFQ